VENDGSIAVDNAKYCAQHVDGNLSGVGPQLNLAYALLLPSWCLHRVLSRTYEVRAVGVVYRETFMTKTTLALAAATILATSAIALAQSTAPAPAPAASPAEHQMAATMVCRPAASGEPESAKHTTGTSLICKKMDGVAMITGKSGPKTDGLSAPQVDAAWRDFVYRAVMVRSGDGGG